MKLIFDKVFSKKLGDVCHLYMLCSKSLGWSWTISSTRYNFDQFKYIDDINSSYVGGKAMNITFRVIL